ncbi:hypothetical protein Calhy_0745 [Caldicellulosiruptor hydrothermalis 108]|uniref:Uncharacterized protein n=1 Tax=Caldicellulosiruptor hydrothermalis (strain DSM 18901 / VKM B-2411 / 108) TaxID=632292 RepID=E4QDR5_CALH1|nr:hypothetical protein [Caldicellulosiruptor hydrothermalis]ADQ06482.1 hypothetical protein Calhy_0745 [Caldicellulosiruptor hydrothermalis 108]
MWTIENLRVLDNLEAKKVVINELLKKFEYLRKLEKLCEADVFCLVSDRDARIDIFDKEYVEKVKAMLAELQEKVRQEIIDLERQYLELCK